MSAKSTSDHANFFRYTSGRWIWDEDQQLRHRFRPFNVEELQRVAAKSVGARFCVTMTKLAEGSFNKVFRLVMDDGKVVIVRISNPNAGPEYLTTASEVATMDMLRTVLDIPVPKVYGWNASAANPVGAEYIIMQEAVGMQVGNSWERLELADRVAIMKQLVSIETKLLSLCFTRYAKVGCGVGLLSITNQASSYGNLYYADEAIKGAVAAEVVGSAPSELKEQVRKRFTIGPVVTRDFWSGERSKMDVDRGPWTSPKDYASAIARREIAWIRQFAVPKTADDPMLTSISQNSPDDHVRLLHKYLKVVPHLPPTDADIMTSHLWHTDLHSGNIFVEGSRITSIIDWQSAWAGPLFLQARHPRLVNYQGDMVLKLPENFRDLGDDEKVRIKSQVAKSIITHLYELNTAKQNPRLNKVFRSKHGRTRWEPIQFAGDTWDDDILPLRESLIRVEKYWSELDTGIACPIHFTEEELLAHSKDGEGWNEVQDFWDSVAGIVTRDGWTPNDEYDTAVALFSELRETGLQNLTGKDKEKFREQTRWAEGSVPLSDHQRRLSGSLDGKA
ncbi:MAG: Phosphotransferase enzyme [Caeruleum heppii]|nr:MAG: Phosphotransferase enzyme [Caeruleum heppii]